MRYASIASGIEAPSVAWHELGWVPVFFAENAPAPSRILARHYPAVPNHGDINGFREWPDHAIDLLVAGTPCQTFSLAGGRAGLDDPRGHLTLTGLAVADRYRPRWFIWENVTGALSANGGRAFGSFLGGLALIGFGFAYRVLDSCHFGSPLRGRRVFVVGHSGGDWRRAAAVLFERAATFELRKEAAGVPRIDASGLAKKQTMPERGRCWTIHDGAGHRFLTPVEVERLFGFPDGYTGGQADGPRYKQLGNSMSVHVMRWIGRRIQMVEDASAEITAGRAA